MKIFFRCIFLLNIITLFALDNSNFQLFDDQYNFGYGASNTLFSNGIQNQTLQQNQFLNLEVERLFDIGIWMDINANIVTSQNSLGNQAVGTGQGNSGIIGFPGMPSTQDPNLGGVNAKLGYAFVVINDNLQLTPYALVGRNTNLAMSTIVSNGFSNVTNNYYYTGGFGGRLEYRINNSILLYFDQSISYNWDQSGPVAGIQPQNNFISQTTLGSKFNIVKNLQLGINGFYKNYQYMSSVPSATPSNNGGSDGNGNLVTIYQAQNSLGGMITVGLTY